MSCVPFEIELEVLDPVDKPTRKITFGLVKACLDNGKESWKINFELDEGTGDGTFNEVAKVSVDIGEQDQPAAKAIADNKSLSDAQAAQTLTAADTVKASSDPANDPDVHDDVTQILHADD